ncbi:MAG: nitrate reductase molybdenum cofactor assembly chaperone [Burkholderiales bacterium]
MLSALLDYPDQDLLDALPDMRAALLGHRALPPSSRAALRELVDGLRAKPLIELQEAYVEAFDRGRASSLYLFEHVHGESRERGQAMVDLLAMYEAKGLFLSAGELPDFLPVFLEFLAHETPAQARTLLGEIAGISRAIATGLAERGDPYFAAVAALLPLAGEAPLSVPSGDMAAGPPDAVDGEALDRAWESEPVTFVGAQAPVAGQGRGQGQGHCQGQGQGQGQGQDQGQSHGQPVEFYRKRPSR